MRLLTAPNAQLLGNACGHGSSNAQVSDHTMSNGDSMESLKGDAEMGGTIII